MLSQCHSSIPAAAVEETEVPLVLPPQEVVCNMYHGNPVVWRLTPLLCTHGRLSFRRELVRVSVVWEALAPSITAQHTVDCETDVPQPCSALLSQSPQPSLIPLPPDKMTRLHRAHDEFSHTQGQMAESHLTYSFPRRLFYF